MVAMKSQGGSRLRNIRSKMVEQGKADRI